MVKTEREIPQEYKEKSLNQAGWLVRLLVGRRDIDKRNLKVFIDPENPASELISFRMRIPGWPVEKQESNEVDMLCSCHSPTKERPWESIIISLQLPDFLQNKELPHFCDEAVENWHLWVNKELLPKKIKADWRVLPGIKEDDQAKIWLDSGNLITGEEDGLVYLVFEDCWDVPYDQRDYGGKSKEEYAQNILDDFSHSYGSLTFFLDRFNKHDIPRLIKEREKRVKTKPKGWLWPAIKVRRDVRDLEYSWLMPDRGIEPETHGVAGTILMKNKEECWFMATAKEIAGDEDMAALNYIHFLVFLPEEIQSFINQKEQGEVVFAQKLGKYLKEQQALEKLIIFDVEKFAVFKYFQLVRAAWENDSQSSLTALEAEFWGIETELLHQAGFNNEKIINQTIEAFINLYPYISNFLRSFKK